MKHSYSAGDLRESYGIICAGPAGIGPAGIGPDGSHERWKRLAPSSHAGTAPTTASIDLLTASFGTHPGAEALLLALDAALANLDLHYVLRSV